MGIGIRRQEWCIGPKRHGWWVLFASVALALFALPEILLGRVYISDTLLQYYPWRWAHSGLRMGWVDCGNISLYDTLRMEFGTDSFVSQWLARGQLPLWDPTIFSGRPLLANGHSCLLYPVKLLFQLTCPPWLSHNLRLLFHLTLGSCMAYRFLGIWVKTPAAAALGAVTWMYNASVLALLEFQIFVSVHAWLATSLYFLERLVRKRDRFSFLGLSLAAAMMLECGHVQACLIAAGFLFAYGLSRIALLDSDSRWTRLALGLALTLAALLALALSAPQWLPVWELFSLSGRTGSASAEFHWENLLTLGLPELLGSPTHQFVWARHYSSLNTPYETLAAPGLVALQFVLLAPRHRHRGLAWFCGILAAGTLTLVMVEPLRQLLGAPFQAVNVTRLIFVLVPCGGILAGLGADVAWQERRMFWRLLVPPALATLVVFGLCWVIQSRGAFYHQLLASFLENKPFLGCMPSYVGIQAFTERAVHEAQMFYWPWNPAFAIPLVCSWSNACLWWLRSRSRVIPAAAVLGLIIVELLSFGWRWNPTMARQDLYPVTPSLRELQQSQRVLGVTNGPPPGLLTAYGIRDAGGYDALYPGIYRLLFSQLTTSQMPAYHILMVLTPSPDFLRWIAILGVDTLYSDPINPPPTPAGWTRQDFPGLVLMHNPEPTPRIRLVRDYRVADIATTMEILASAEFLPKQQICVLRGWDSHPPRPGPASGQVDWLLDTPNHQVLAVETPENAIVVMTDQYFPGWECWVDGQPGQIQRANLAQRAIAVPAGKHRLELRYRPRSLRSGLRLAGLAILALVLCWCFPRRVTLES